jgi:hypothetical protein
VEGEDGQPGEKQARRGEDGAGDGGRRVDQERDGEEDGCDETQHCASFRSAAQEPGPEMPQGGWQSDDVPPGS